MGNGLLHRHYYDDNAPNARASAGLGLRATIIHRDYVLLLPRPLKDPKMEPPIIPKFAQCINGLILGGSIFWILSGGLGVGPLIIAVSRQTCLCLAPRSSN